MTFLKASNQRFQQTMVMITHNPEIAQMADRIIRIEDGKIQNTRSGHSEGISRKEGLADVSGKE